MTGLNILWISFEDTYPYYGCYGDPVARTPRLDRLAAEGCVYSNAFSTAPVCSPARSAAITGMYPVAIGTHHHRTNSGDQYPQLGFSYEAVPPHFVKCVPEFFRAAGYYCTNCGKTDYQFAAPRSAWDACNGQAHWRNRPDPAQPFFAVFNLSPTHESGMWEEKGTADPSIDRSRIPVPPYFPNTPKVRESLARMYANIEANDRRLGELLDQLEADGLAENTLVVRWSDHGPMPRGKRWLYDSGIRVPMIVRWPGRVRAGARNPRLVSTVDLPASMLSAAGLTIPPWMQGRAFLGAAAAPEREYVFASRDRYDEMYDMVRAVRTGRFKYIRNYQPEQPYLLWNAYRNKHPIMQELWRCHVEGTLAGPQTLMFREHRPAEELYDIEADPHEVRDLAGDPAYADELARLRAALDAWRSEVRDLGDEPEAMMGRRMWPDGKQPVTQPPQCVVLGPHARGDVIMPEPGGTVRGPAILQLQSATQGASISYGLGDEEPCRLYTAPLRLSLGRTRIRAVANRIGYRDSTVVEAIYEVIP